MTTSQMRMPRKTAIDSPKASAKIDALSFSGWRYAA